MNLSHSTAPPPADEPPDEDILEEEDLVDELTEAHMDVYCNDCELWIEDWKYHKSGSKRIKNCAKTAQKYPPLPPPPVVKSAMWHWLDTPKDKDTGDSASSSKESFFSDWSKFDPRKACVV